SGNTGSDALAVASSTLYGEAGESVTLNYTLDSSGTASNSLTYTLSGTGGTVPTAVTAAGTSTSAYTITAGNASSGVVTITGTFEHTNSSGISNDATLTAGTLAGQTIDGTWTGGLTIASSSALTVTVSEASKTNAALSLIKGNSKAAVKYVIGPEPADDSEYTQTYSGSDAITVADNDVIWILVISEDGSTQSYYKITVTVAPGVAPTITTAALGSGRVGAAYGATLTATGDPAITWSLDSGSLPDGLTLSPSGVISGTPALAGTFAFTVKAENAAGSDTKALTITIADAAPSLSSDATLASLTADPAVLIPAFRTDITAYTAAVSSSVENVTIAAAASDPRAVITASDLGVKRLAVGVNTFTVRVTAQDGTTKIYTITITRAQGPTVTPGGSGSSSSGGGGSSSSGSSSTSGGSSSPSASGGDILPAATVDGKGVVTPRVDIISGKATVTISDYYILRAIDATFNDVRENGGEPLVTIQFDPKTAKAISVNFTKGDLNKIAELDTKLKIDVEKIGTLVFDLSALDGLAEYTNEEPEIVTITITLIQPTALPEDLRELAPDKSAVVEVVVKIGNTVVKNYGKGIAALTVPYTLPNGVGGTQVVPYFLNESAKTLELVSGGYVPALKAVSLNLRHLSKYVIKVNDAKYTVSEGWHNSALDFAMQRHLLDSYVVEGRIDAGQGVTRGDFITAVMKSLDIQPATKFTVSQFEDVGGVNAAYIRTAKELGIVSGMNPARTIYEPDRVTTRGEQFQILYNLIQAGLTTTPKVDTGRDLSFAADADTIPEWLKPAATRLLKLGVIEGDEARRLNINEKFTVGTTAVILEKISAAE
ncbi:MAG: cadherin-like beta sandwich domain-containing protein, partial [Clostridiales bacterium]|nr:cadherin-like beta sandwich domain-containing protein [Clostridiales bacterium]